MRLFANVCLIVSFLAIGAQAAEPTSATDVLRPTLVHLTPERVFAPQSYDESDNAQVVLDGALPDTCHKLGPTIVQVDERTHRISLRQHAYHYGGGWCAEVRIPYTVVVNLGLLEPGIYAVSTLKADSTIAATTTLPVAAAGAPEAENVLYAPVSDVTLEASRPPVTRFTLHGAFPTNCMALAEVKTTVRANGVIEVLPMASYDQQSARCVDAPVEFTVPVELTDLAHGRYLVNVRSLNGQSVNRVFDL